MNCNSEKAFYTALDRLERNPSVGLLKNYTQHKGNKTFRHCHNVAVHSFRLAQRLGWRIDEESLATGAMLHDYYLYTFHDEKINFLHHGLSHPKRALANAERVFPLNSKERNIIESHMWPLTLLTLPRSKEAVLVTLADKYCAMCEFRGRMHDQKEVTPRRAHASRS